MSDGSNERYPSVALKNGAISIFTKIKGIEVVRNTNAMPSPPMPSLNKQKQRFLAWLNPFCCTVCCITRRITYLLGKPQHDNATADNIYYSMVMN